LLRALPYRAARRHLMLPMDALRGSGLSPENIFAGEASASLTAAIARIAEAAAAHLAAARAARTPRKFLPALLPAASVPLYLGALTRPGFNPFRDSVDIPIFRRQFAMLGAILRGRL
jgi:phytoene/squalene synthetase